MHHLMKSPRGLWPKRFTERVAMCWRLIEAESRGEPGLPTPRSHCAQGSPHAWSHLIDSLHVS